MRETLPKSSILRGYKVFSTVKENGIHFQTPHLHCYVTNSSQEKTIHTNVQIGFGVAKKIVPLAVHRNRIKRLLREVYRKNKQTLDTFSLEQQQQLKILLLFRLTNKEEKIWKISYHLLEQEWKELVEKILTIKKSIT